MAVEFYWTMDNTTDLIFACFCGVLAFLALVGLVYIIVDDTIRFKKRREYMMEMEGKVNRNDD